MESLKRPRNIQENQPPRKKLKTDYKYPRDGNTLYMTPLQFIQDQPSHFISLRQLLYQNLLQQGKQQRNLQSILMTTYCYETSFIAPILQSLIPFCLITHGPQTGIHKISDTFTVIQPAIQVSWGNFHPKLFLLKFPTRLRIVVCSANLLLYDWSKIGQVLWFQDFFPGRASGSFYRELKGFVERITGSFSVQQELKIDLSAYDFRSAAVQLVTSVPGRHQDVFKYGQGRIRGILEQKNMEFRNFTFQCSSIGNLSAPFVNSIVKSFCNNSSGQMQLVFPSYQRVENSILGLGGGGTSFLKEENYENESFPKGSLRDIGAPQEFPQIENHLSHSKVMICHNNFDLNSDSLVYIGSHNFSSAAWGKYEKNGKQLFISNFQIGVVFVKQSSEEKEEIVKRLPFRFPPPQYPEDSEPWFINKYLAQI